MNFILLTHYFNSKKKKTSISFHSIFFSSIKHIIRHLDLECANILEPPVEIKRILRILLYPFTYITQSIKIKTIGITMMKEIKRIKNR